MDESGDAVVVLSEQSVLAENFVPQHLREINEWQVTASFVAVSHRPATAAAGPRGLLVPFCPICYCLGHQRLSTSKPHHTFPIAHDSLPDDLYYAVEKRRRTFHLVAPATACEPPSSNVDGPPSRPMQPKDALQSGTSEPASVDNISNLDEYLSTWEELLSLERLELLHRYENYSQYSRPVNVQSIDSNGSPNEHVATIYVAGIADASPPILIGDTVLVRPMHVLSLPLMLGASSVSVPLKYQQWSPPVHVVEIRATALSVQRGTTGPPAVTDLISITWIQPSEWDTLRHTLKMKHLTNIQSGGKQLRNTVNASVQPTFNVRFVPSTTTHQRCVTALQWLGEAYRDNPRACMELLFPTTAPVVTVSLGAVAAHDILSRTHQHAQLNDKQASFVSMVLARTRQPSENQIRPPMVLTGPAGTGKTKTMLSAVHGILTAGSSTSTEYRILICTPSHTAADVITRRLGEQLNRNQLFRMYSADRPVATVPVQVLGFCRQSDDQTGTFILPDISILMKFQVIVCTCSDAHMLYRVGLTNQQLRIRRRCFELFLSKTCEGTNLACTLTGVDDPHFTHLFIDEAAQATEPETLIPFSVVLDAAGCRAVEIALVGDPRQLSPSVYSSAAAAAGLDRSLLERLLQRPVTCLGGGREHMLGPDFERMEDWIQYSFQRDGHEQLSVFLTTNYRGHPTFLMMPSVLFYSDKLQSANYEKEQDAGESFWCEKLRHIENLTDPIVSLNGSTNVPDGILCRKQFSWPLHLRGVVGKETSVTVKSGFSSSSWENMAEAQVVLDICVTLHEKGVSPKSIGVMASFRGQVVLIRKLLRSKHLSGVNVGTIEDYQSVEHDVIVLSLVRGTPGFVDHDIKNRAGVFGQPKRANVALTRAEFLFIVVGNPVVMSQDAVWLQYMLFCHRNGLFYGDAPDDTSVLHWNETKSMVRYPPKLTATIKPSMLNGSHELETTAPSIVTVGTLERALRN